MNDQFNKSRRDAALAAVVALIESAPWKLMNSELLLWDGREAASGGGWWWCLLIARLLRLVRLEGEWVGVLHRGSACENPTSTGRLCRRSSRAALFRVGAEE
jgi:hypothetical protein